jgi:prepilin-type N-terminal cleavage/methylation domain-containing protein
MYDARYRMKNNNGFTLLEIIIVLVLMALILGLSTIFFANTLPSSRLNATAREISAAIRHARHLALINGEKQTMTINLDSRYYSIEGIAQKSIPSGITPKVIDPLLGEVRNGDYSIIFHATGAMEGGTIVLSTEKKTVSIQLDPVVGSVVIK